MAYDSYGNWISNRHAAPIGPFPGPVNGLLFGDGAPDAGTGQIGNVYVDVLNSAIYFFSSGGWQEVSAGGGTGGAGMVGVVDPEGVVVADIGTVYANRVEHTLWYKETGSGTATFWQQYS